MFTASSSHWCNPRLTDLSPLLLTVVTGNEQEGRRLAWLKEVEMPRDLKMCSVRYGGPPVSDR